MSPGAGVIRETQRVQRNLAGIFFLVAGVMVSIAFGAWWLQRTAFTPTADTGPTAAILQDELIRSEITSVVTAATAATLEREPSELASFVDQVIRSRPGASVMAEIVADAHGRAIGNHELPVRISGEQMIEIVRSQAVGDLPSVTLPVSEVSTLRFLANVLGWVAGVTMIIGAIAFLLGVIVRPERGEVARAFAELCLALGASLVVFGLLVPIFVLPAINDTTWMSAVPRLAIRTAPLVLVAAVLFMALGLFVLLKTLSSGRRKQWSTPLAVGRYREDRSWS
jgi:hypothetical protein